MQQTKLGWFLYLDFVFFDDMLKTHFEVLADSWGDPYHLFVFLPGDLFSFKIFTMVITTWQRYFSYFFVPSNQGH